MHVLIYHAWMVSTENLFGERSSMTENITWNILPNDIEVKVAEYLSKSDTDKQISAFDFRLGVRWLMHEMYCKSINLDE